MTAQAPNTFFATSSEEQSRRAKLPRGDRTKLAKRYFADLYQAWEEQGDSVLRRAAFHDPMGFARMVAGLMPQKLEITHPTDGLTDERLAHLLELAERMATLKLNGIDEKRLIDVTPERGGGGPERVGDAGGEGCPSTTRVAEIPASTDPSNRLNDVTPENTSQERVAEAPKSEHDEAAARAIAEESDYAIQPPVGKPFATLEHDEKRENLKKLTEGVSGSERDDSEIDPASLF